MNFKVKNDSFLRALLRQPTDYTPVWMMRQAGRYLPEYCATRKRAGSFLICARTRICHRGYLAAAGALPAGCCHPVLGYFDCA